MASTPAPSVAEDEAHIDRESQLQYRANSSLVKDQRESLSLWCLKRNPDYEPHELSSYLSTMPLELPPREAPSQETVPLHLFKPGIDGLRPAPGPPPASARRPSSAKSPRFFGRPSSALSASTQLGAPKSSEASIRRAPPSTFRRTRPTPYYDPPVTAQRKVLSEQIATQLEGVEVRDTYLEPAPPELWWPPEKPPTLQQMERDMLLWARAGHEVKTKSFHEGRVAEYKRAREVFLGLIARNDRIASLNVNLRRELTARRVDQETKDTKVLECEAALEGQTTRYEAAKRHLDSVISDKEEVEREFRSLKERFDAEVNVAKEHFEDEAESRKLETDSLRARVVELESQLAESTALNARASAMLNAQKAERDGREKAAAAFQVPVPADVEPVIEEALAVAMIPLKQAMAMAARTGALPPSVSPENELPWWNAAAFSQAEPRVVAAMGHGLVSRAHDECAAKFGNDRWSAQYGRTYVQHVYKRGGRVALAALLLDSGLVRATVDEIVETLETRMPATSAVHEAAARVKAGGFSSMAKEMTAIDALEADLSEAADEGVPSTLLAPYHAMLVAAKSRAGPVLLLQSSVRGRQARDEWQLVRAAVQTLQSKVKARRQRKAYQEERAAAVKIQATVGGRVTRQQLQKEAEVRGALRVAEESTAANAIQNRHRAQLQKRKAVQQYDEQKGAIIRIQTSARGRTARKEVDELRAMQSESPKEDGPSPKPNFSKNARLKRMKQRSGSMDTSPPATRAPKRA